jgi:tight adherence protein C
MSITVILSAAAVGISIPLLWWTLASGRSSRGAVAHNLAQGLPVSRDLRQLALTESVHDRTLKPFLRGFADLTRRITPQGWLASLEHRLIMAGQPKAWPLERFLAAKALSATGGMLVGVLRLLTVPGARSLIIAVAAVAVGFFLPDLLLMRNAQQRQKEIRRMLPDTLDQMTICVEAGLGFEGAMARAAKTGSGPVAEEFRRTLQEMQIGATRGQALRSLQQRTDVQELRRFTTALTQAEAYGLPIADVLRVQAAELRMKRKQRAEERAMKLPVKVVFPLVLCILPALFVVVLGPAGLRIARFFSGEGL